jgi:hypothetical protein
VPLPVPRRSHAAPYPEPLGGSYLHTHFRNHLRTITSVDLDRRTIGRLEARYHVDGLAGVFHAHGDVVPVHALA